MTKQLRTLALSTGPRLDSQEEFGGTKQPVSLSIPKASDPFF